MPHTTHTHTHVCGKQLNSERCYVKFAQFSQRLRQSSGSGLLGILWSSRRGNRNGNRRRKRKEREAGAATEVVAAFPFMIFKCALRDFCETFISHLLLVSLVAHQRCHLRHVSAGIRQPIRSSIHIRIRIPIRIHIHIRLSCLSSCCSRVSLCLCHILMSIICVKVGQKLRCSFIKWRIIYPRMFSHAARKCGKFVVPLEEALAWLKRRHDAN